MDAERAETPGDVAAGHDEVALGEVLHVHDAPHQGETVGRQRKDRSDQQTIDQQAQVEDGRRRKDRNVAGDLVHDGHSRPIVLGLTDVPPLAWYASRVEAGWPPAPISVMRLARVD